MFTINVTIKNIAKIIADTKKGHFKIFCNAIDHIIVANGRAKNISKISILISPFLILLYFMLFQINLLNIKIKKLFVTTKPLVLFDNFLSFDGN